MVRVAGVAIGGMLSAASALRRPRPPGGAPHGLIALTVTRRRIVARDQDVVELTLTATDGSALPEWYPGAHIDLHLPSGRIRQYSLCGDPRSRDGYRIAVRRIPDGGGGSVEVHDLPLGTQVHTHGPRNAFPLTVPGFGSPTRRLRFIAGGIGITPILPMLQRAQQLGIDWSMIYAGRSADSLPFLDEVGAFGDAVVVRTDDRNGTPGAAELLGDCAAGTAVYACGPAPMLTALRAALAGRDDVELHFERFAAAPVVDGHPFDVTVASSGQTVAVGADETLLAALRRNAVAAPYSCQQGFCGTCRTQVLAGEVDHRDTLLSEPERAARQMLTCVSRAARGSALTLDL
ncbi:oxidoreductase [Mycolicibacterium duvalii]|nr:PDR/VanB family oxidoreductase [Mycolicibacterium duvalii]MCV7370335.1 oxidoreductase [Mycolicibacterium duvalii]PEG37312.1 oxidoreductase [Mycolicibacterium duvalii]